MAEFCANFLAFDEVAVGIYRTRDCDRNMFEKWASRRARIRSRPRFQRTRYLSNSATVGCRNPAFGRRPPLRAARVVRTLARDRHVVHVALAQAGVGDAQEFRLLVQVRE